jgi:hypothetical protein
MSDPQQRDLLIERLHVLIAETRRCIDDHRLVRADDKLNAMDENCELLQAEIVRLRAEKDAAESALHGLREQIKKPLSVLRDIGNDLNDGRSIPNLAEKIWDECDRLSEAAVAPRPPQE